MTGLDASARLALAAAGPAAPFTTASALRDQYLAEFAATQNPPEPVASDRCFRLGDLRLRVWRGQGAPAANAPALLYLHGGGWMIGTPETHEDICRSLANRAGAVVVSPDYRLAPEHPFPSGLNDAAQALQWMVSSAAELGIAPARIAVGGDSAGGNLAAVLALMARAGDVPPVVAQLLIYPVTDHDHDTDSFRRFASGFGLSATEMERFRDAYLPDPADRADWRAAPLRAPSLRGVAPASVVLAGHDVLWSEGRAYADRLTAEADEKGGARVHDWPGQIHGFVSKGGLIPQASDALGALVADWRDFDRD